MMINRTSTVGRSVFTSISSSSILNPQGGSKKKEIFADLLLTALIDAFSILVIFLLMSFSSSGEIVYITKGMELPAAKLGAMLERNTIIKLEEGKFYLEDQEVKPNHLVAALMQVRKDHKDLHPDEEFPGILTIQADRRAKYSELNSIVLASGNAGFSDIKFAVLMK